MRYTIITPTICRSFLPRLCESIDAQTSRDWEHIIAVDIPENSMTREQRKLVASIPVRENRIFVYCDRKHRNFGNTCRHNAWAHANGEYIFYVDDDDYLSDNSVLSALDSVTELWAVFPLLRHGQRFFALPPKICNIGGGMFMHKKELGRWPDCQAYEADGIFVEELAQKYPYQVLDEKPLVIQPQSSFGLKNVHSWWGKRAARYISRRLWQRYLDKAASQE